MESILQYNMKKEKLEREAHEKAKRDADREAAKEARSDKGKTNSLSKEAEFDM